MFDVTAGVSTKQGYGITYNQSERANRVHEG